MALANKPIIKDQSLLRHEDIKQHIRVVPELASYIPPLLPDEYRQLEENILQNGCREALLVWEAQSDQLPGASDSGPAYVLIDGHNRYAICLKHQLDFKVHLMHFSTLEQVKFFMIDNQLGRRNLSPEQVSYLRGIRYLNQKQDKGKYERNKHKGQNDPYVSKPNEVVASTVLDESTKQEGADRESTALQLAKQFNVSEKTIKRDAAFAQGLDRLTPSFKEDVLAGKVSVDKSLVQQLGRMAQVPTPIASLAELVHLGRPELAESTVTKATQTASRSKSKVLTLKRQLQRLVSQLDNEQADLAELCSAIIDCASQLGHYKV